MKKQILILVLLFALVSGACGSRVDFAATQTASVTDTPTLTPTDTPPQPQQNSRHPRNAQRDAYPNRDCRTDCHRNAHLATQPVHDLAKSNLHPMGRLVGGDEWCLARGTNVTCEIEYRNYSGQCLVGMTCFDACGKYYGVDTIRNGVDPTLSADRVIDDQKNFALHFCVTAANGLR